MNDDVIQGIQAMVTTEEFTSVVSLFGSYSGSSNSSGCLADREKFPALHKPCSNFASKSLQPTNGLHNHVNSIGVSALRPWEGCILCRAAFTVAFASESSQLWYWSTDNLGHFPAGIAASEGW